MKIQFANKVIVLSSDTGKLFILYKLHVFNHYINQLNNNKKLLFLKKYNRFLPIINTIKQFYKSICLIVARSDPGSSGEE